MDYPMTSYISEAIIAGVLFRPDSFDMTEYMQLGGGGGGNTGVSVVLLSSMNIGIGRGG